MDLTKARRDAGVDLYHVAITTPMCFTTTNWSGAELQTPEYEAVYGTLSMPPIYDCGVIRNIIERWGGHTVSALPAI
jgi:hypothetical protein